MPNKKKAKSSTDVVTKRHAPTPTSAPIPTNAKHHGGHPTITSPTPSAQPVAAAAPASARVAPQDAAVAVAQDDFQRKNARAKSLIMAGLVPGSESYKMAESHELALDSWKALQEKYAPDHRVAAFSARAPLALEALRLDFLADWIEGKSLDQYTERYVDLCKTYQQGEPLAKQLTTLTDGQQQNGVSRDVAAQDGRDGVSRGAAATHTRGGVLHDAAAAEPKRRGVSYDAATPTDPKLGSGREAHSPQQSQAVTAPRGRQQEHHHQHQPLPQPPAAAAAAKPTLLPWRPKPVKHGSYLSEAQALSFAAGDAQRQTQVQLATAKVLMRKLPTRDLRFLWAVLYGGEDAPWPGSFSVFIPGVTIGISHFRDENG